MVPGMAVEVVCGLIEKEPGLVLACKRRVGGHLGGCWEFPGGKVEVGEAPEAALVRELAEELAVEVVVVSAMTPVDWDYGRGAIRLLPYRCVLKGGEPEALEHEEIRWCDAGALGGLEWAAADVPVLEEWLRGIGH